MLKNLSHLYIRQPDYDLLNDDVLLCLTKLMSLTIKNQANNITLNSLNKLTNLTDLSYWNPVDGNVNVNESLMKLTKIKRLHLCGNPGISGMTMKCLTNLTYLSLDGKNEVIENRKRILHRKEDTCLDFVYINQQTIQYFYA